MNWERQFRTVSFWIFIGYMAASIILWTANHTVTEPITGVFDAACKPVMQVVPTALGYAGIVFGIFAGIGGAWLIAPREWK